MATYALIHDFLRYSYQLNDNIRIVLFTAPQKPVKVETGYRPAGGANAALPCYLTGMGDRVLLSMPETQVEVTGQLFETIRVPVTPVKL